MTADIVHGQLVEDHTDDLLERIVTAIDDGCPDSMIRTLIYEQLLALAREIKELHSPMF